MKRNLFLTIIAIIIVAVAGVLYFSYSGGNLQKIVSPVINKPQVDLSGNILFFGNGCPHCANVEKFIADNKVNDVMKIDYREIPFNNNDNQQLEENANLLAQLAGKCGIQLDKVGIPFLWDGKTCIIGEVDIIKLLQEKVTIWNSKK